MYKKQLCATDFKVLERDQKRVLVETSICVCNRRFGVSEQICQQGCNLGTVYGPDRKQQSMELNYSIVVFLTSLIKFLLQDNAPSRTLK